MKDFRAFGGSDSSEPQGPTVGGSAFGLPSIPLIGSLGFASLAMLLRPWQLLRVLPFRRRGLIGSFFSWGRLATIALAVMLVLSPSTLEHSFPEWRSLGAICFCVSALSVLGAISRCCGSALACAFWVALTLFMGEKAFRPGQLTGVLDGVSLPSFSTAALVDDTPVLIEDGEWEDMVTGEPVSARTVAYSSPARPQLRQAPRPRSVSRVQPPVRAVPANQGIFGSFSQGISGQLDSVLPGASAFSASVGIPGSRAWQDGAALPESAYFGGGAKFGPVGEAFEDSSGSALGGGLDQIVEQVGSLLGR